MIKVIAVFLIVCMGFRHLEREEITQLPSPNLKLNLLIISIRTTASILL